MMLTKLLKQQALILTLKKFSKKYSEVWDIAVYGSAVRGKQNPGDLDFALILSKKIDESKKLALAQEVKAGIGKVFPSIQIDVKTVVVDDFLDEHFLARQGIIAEGFLLLRKESLAKKLGFATFMLVKYSLQGLTSSQKKMLYYALKGRRDSKGVLTQIGGELISREVLKIPIESSFKIEELLSMHQVRFTTEFMMIYRKR